MLIRKKVFYFILLLSTILVSCGIDGRKSSVGTSNTANTVGNNNLNKLNDLENQQKFDKVIPELEKIYNSNPDNVASVLNYTSVLLDKGSIKRHEKEYADKVLSILKKTIEKHPSTPELYINMGYAYEIKEDYKNSFNAYNKAIELDPKNALAYAHRGHAYRLYGDRVKAEKDFIKAYKINPKDDFVLLNMAWLVGKEGFSGIKEALGYYQQIIQNTKNIRFKSEAYYGMGYLYIAKGNYDEAEKSFRNAIKSDEKYELGYLGLSEVLMLKLIYRAKDKKEKLKLFKNALKYNELAISLNPKRAISYMKKGLILKDMGKYKKDAILMFHLALDAIPGDISLGKKEKEQLKIYINKLLKDEN